MPTTYLASMAFIPDHGNCWIEAPPGTWPVLEESESAAGAPAEVSPERKEEERETGRQGGEDQTRSELAGVRAGCQQENKAADCRQRGLMSECLICISVRGKEAAQK